MSLRRSPDPSRRSRRLAVCGVTAALLVVPGVAQAAPPADPLDAVTAPVEEVVGGLTGQVPAPGADDAATDDTGTDTAAAAPSVPSLDPAQLTALLAQLGVTPDCVTAIQGDLVATLTSIPATVQQLITLLGDNLTELQEDPENGPALLQDALADLLGGALGGGGAAATPTGAAGLPLLGALEDLVQDFLTVCLPKPAAATTAPTPAPAAPVVQTTAPVAAPAPTTTAAPVAYLGYAPTGAPEEDSGAGTPLLALGGVLLLGGGAAGTWMRLRRGVSSRG